MLRSCSSAALAHGHRAEAALLAAASRFSFGATPPRTLRQPARGTQPGAAAAWISLPAASASPCTASAMGPALVVGIGSTRRGAGRCETSRALHGDAADAARAVNAEGEPPSELPAGGEAEDLRTREWEAALVVLFSEETPIGALTGMRLSFEADGAAGTT